MSRKKLPPSGPNNAYLISFGDTMTALLAFFIVLNSLAEEQTGANLHSGTGSFVQALQTFGLPGMFSSDYSARAFQSDEMSPLYIAESDEDAESEPNPKGPDDNDDGIRVIDRELEQFQRFFDEMDRFHDVESVPDVAGEISFDLFNPLATKSQREQNGAFLRPVHLDAMLPIAPLLRSDSYEIELTVWATTPSPSAWSRAVKTAETLKQEIITNWRLTPSQSGRLMTSGRPWFSAQEKRPVLTLTSRRLVDSP